MAPSENEIRSLLALGYSPSSVPPLEAYLDAQVTGGAPYIFDAVRTLLKHYQLFPETSNETKIGHGLLLAMLNYPSTDLLALCYLVPHVFAREPYGAIRKCGETLDACQFSEFWKSYQQIQQFTDDAVISTMANASVGRMQGSILKVLALTYKEAPISVVTASLNVDSAAAVEALKHASVEKVTTDSVVFVATADNTKRQRVYQEGGGVNFSTISTLIGNMTQ